MFPAAAAGLIAGEDDGSELVGKPFGVMLASALAAELKVAVKPREYSWAQLARWRE